MAADASARRRPKSVEEAENLVFRLLDDPERSVLVLGRTVLVDRRLFVRPNKKGLLHLEFLRSLLERGASGNVAYRCGAEIWPIGPGSAVSCERTTRRRDAAATPPRRRRDAATTPP